MGFRNSGIMPFEVDVLFRQILNMDQIKYITSLLIILGKYMVLDREMIDIRAGKIGLSYIEKAKKSMLITEYQHMDEQGIREYYFYSLAPGGIYFLESEGFPFHKLPKYTNQEHRERILTFNKWAIGKGYTINVEMPQSRKFDFFLTNEKKVGYFHDVISEQQVKEQLQAITEENFTFETIDIPMISIGNKSSPSN